MLTVALALLVVLLSVALGVVWKCWRDATHHISEQALTIRHQCERIDGYRAELDALSIAGPRIDTATGGHDQLPIRDDIRATLTAYCEGMWQHTQEQP